MPLGLSRWPHKIILPGVRPAGQPRVRGTPSETAEKTGNAADSSAQRQSVPVMAVMEMASPFGILLPEEQHHGCCENQEHREQRQQDDA